MSETNLQSKKEQDIHSISSKETLYTRDIDSNDQGIINIISMLLTNICEDNNNKIQKEITKCFESETQPSISIEDYITRLYNFSKSNESTIIASLIYIDRFCQNNNFILTKYNIYKLILTSFVVAMKYNEDFIYSMDIFSKIGGLSLSELKKLELKFLFMIQFDLYIDKELYENYYNNLMDLSSETEEIEESEENEDIISVKIKLNSLN